MKLPHDLHRQHTMLKCLSALPRKMVRIHGVDHVAECVLHDLCHEECFDLQKAAYFVDNPDFNLITGIAGFSRADVCNECHTLWDNSKEFNERMKNSAFNKKVREVSRVSAYKNSTHPENIVDELAHNLGFGTYEVCIWPMKYNNHGIVLYEKSEKHDVALDDHLEHGFSLLSFCPII